MSTICRLVAFHEDPAHSDVAVALQARADARALRVVNHEITAIEYTFDTAGPGEVIFVDEEAYYNPYLWHSYGDLNTRYLCP